MTYWNTWVRQPQTVSLRKAIFQVHLWTGIALGVYILAICVSGSVLVYRNELYQAFTPKPVFVERRQTPLSPEQLTAAAQRSFDGYEVARIWPGQSPDQAVELELTREDTTLKRLFNPYTGEDLGNSVPAGFRFTAWLLDFHDNLLGGETGRRTNGVGAAMVLVSALTGLVVWWPGIQRWRRSMAIDFRANWRPFNWSLHSALGIWFAVFVLMWGITGLYLSYPKPFSTVVEYLQPFNESSPVERVGDRVLYWLGYAHFGRFGGRIPGCGRGTCDEIFKAVWAVFGLVPVTMAVTGAIMWWNRLGVKSPPRRVRKPNARRMASPADSSR
jgi:uncharacterized iron-regulated membrane protein